MTLCIIKVPTYLKYDKIAKGLIIFYVGELMSNKILKGTALLTGAAFLSKFLGMIYAIPFNEFVGDKGGELYFFAYNPYSILISISTVGIPLAVSKIVSKYNTLGYYDLGLRVFRSSLLFMAITGLLAFITLYFGSGWLASKFIYSSEEGNTVEDVKKVMQMISFSLLIIPAMSVVRGFFQGNQVMEPTAISQVIEQIVRIAVVLIAAFTIIKIYNGSIVLAVSFATFAAFIGAIASCIILLYYWQKHRKQLRKHVKVSQRPLNISTKELVIELFSYAGPFVLVGIAIPLYQSVDSFTFNRAMYMGGYEEIATVSNATINMYGHKLISIPVTIATGMSLTIVPALTESFTRQNRKKLFVEMNQSLQIVLLFVIPAVVGLSALSYEAYGSLFGMKNLAITGNLLAWYAPIALLFALFTVTAAILQGINEQRFTLISLTAGFLVKAIFNSTFIHAFAGKGSILATGLAVSVAVLLNFWRIRRAILFSYKQTLKRTLFMVIYSLIMWGIIIILKYICGMFIPYEESRIAAIFMLSIGVLGGGFVYLFLAYKTTLIDHVFGGTNMLNRFRRKKRAN
ncbi:putative polysaccharide biosynthesis protein [Pseudogracilibacillus auburnensis]|uniref:putative polysaccharide biosynthesis protein n=1 Tax=Pseudogracilibacillus auburnensis TaxID=1494959 RepID=UPI0027D9E4B0|nr:polysaccharide biosynthesis protein [Pseudogracilibacillus auburnensis]